MSLFDAMNNDELEPSEAEILLTAAFSVCSNWPKEQTGVSGLAQELDQASERCGISMQAIVDTCKQFGPLCPTAHDLARVAGEMKARLDEAKAANERRKWEKLYGPPQPYDWQAEATEILESSKVRIAEREEMERRIWEALKKQGRKDRQAVSLHDWFTMQKDLGYTLTPEQRQYV